jgi:hypothetical protein
LAEVAVAASALPPLLAEPEPPLEPPQAVRASPAVTATTAARMVLPRTCPPGSGAAPREVPWWPTSVGLAIVTDGARERAVEPHERVVTLWQRPEVTGR